MSNKDNQISSNSDEISSERLTEFMSGNNNILRIFSRQFEAEHNDMSKLINSRAIKYVEELIKEKEK